MLKIASLLALSLSTGLFAVGCAAEVEDPADQGDEAAQVDPSDDDATAAADRDRVGAAGEAATAEGSEHVGTAEEPMWGAYGYPGYGYPGYGYDAGYGYNNYAYNSSYYRSYTNYGYGGYVGYGYPSYGYPSYGYGYGCAGGYC